MKWFKEKEFACRCCGELPLPSKMNVEALVRNVLDPVREAYGRPIVVNSGYRCDKHNAAVGGVKNSQHLVGQAADIVPVQGSKLKVQGDGSSRIREFENDLQLLARLIKENGRFDQLIIYPTFLHVSYKRNGANRHQVLRKVANGYRRAEV